MPDCLQINSFPSREMTGGAQDTQVYGWSVARMSPAGQGGLLLRTKFSACKDYESTYETEASPHFQLPDLQSAEIAVKSTAP